jgi:uncharacterized protein YodC (DUF2158 family)
MKYEVGTVVCLKSGGPPLTVEPPITPALAEDHFVAVQWFKDDDLMRDLIHEDCLDLAVLVEFKEEPRVLSS